jgi:hypothetical protein
VPSPPLLDEVVAAHGGTAWDAARELSVDASCSGWAFVMKRRRGSLSNFNGTVSTSEPRVVLSPYPEPGQRGVFEDGRVWIEDDSGRVLAERENARAYFKGRRNLWWDDLDLLYFGGYALWGYMNAPFVFRWPGFEVEEAEPWHEGGQTWRGLRVRFPEHMPAHSPEQIYYFGADGLLRRNDYTAQVFGGWAKATHYCWEPRELSGIVVPTRRAAMPRLPNGKPLRQFVLVSIAIRGLRAVPAAGARSELATGRP